MEINNKIKLTVAFAALTLFIIDAALAGPVAVPNSFQSGTAAVAAEVNANFAALETEVNDNDLRIAAIEDSGGGAGTAGLNWAAVNAIKVDVTTQAADLGTVTVNLPSSGYVLVTFSGEADVSSAVQADRVALGASDTSQLLAIKDGKIVMDGFGDLLSTKFSHQRVYAVSSAGEQTYYAVAQRWNVLGGNPLISVTGTLTVQFFPNAY